MMLKQFKHVEEFYVLDHKTTVHWKSINISEENQLTFIGLHGKTQFFITTTVTTSNPINLSMLFRDIIRWLSRQLWLQKWAIIFWDGEQMLKETAVVNNTIIMVIPTVQAVLNPKFGKTIFSTRLHTFIGTLWRMAEARYCHVHRKEIKFCGTKN
jgi:hypothetical protein